MDKFIESNGDINSLEKKKGELEAKVAELQAKVDNSASNAVINEIATEFPDITADNFIFMIVVGIILLILAGFIFYKRKH